MYEADCLSNYRKSLMEKLETKERKEAKYPEENLQSSQRKLLGHKTIQQRTVKRYNNYKLMRS